MTEQPPQNLTPEILVPRLGDYLIERHLITQEQLARVIELQVAARKSGTPALIGQILVDEKMITQAELDQAVTEQIMQLRTALQNANTFLEQRVKERTAELEAAITKLADFDRMKSNIVANISHELRTPMTHIKGYLELLIASILGPLTDEQLNGLQVMQRASERLENLIEDLLQFSEIDQTDVVLNLQPIDLHRLGQTLVNRAKIKAEEKNLQLSLVNQSLTQAV